MNTNDEKIKMLKEFIDHGLPIFPLWGVENGKCQCIKSGKKPNCDEQRKGKHVVDP